jgi:FkbM family methyltransferase
MSRRTLMELCVFWILIFFFFSSPQIDEKDILQKCKKTDSKAIEFGNRQGGTVYINPDITHGRKLKQSVWDLGDRGMVSEVFVMTMDADPPFNFVMPPPSAKEGVQLSVVNDGIFEPETHRLFRWILNGNCMHSNGKRKLVIDAGANLAYFSLFSASMGCRSIAVEPQPRLQPLIKFSFDLNPTFKDRITLHQNAVSDNKNTKLKVVYADICWACSVAEPLKPGEDAPPEMIINPVAISELADEDVMLLKIDVEGHEIGALISAHELIRKRRVENILIEWSPSRWPKLGKTLEDGVKELELLSSWGYVVRHYDLRMVYPQQGLQVDQFPGMGRTWVIPPDQLRSLTKHVEYSEANLWLHLPDSISSRKP